tara:strand:+ start:676 stop:972 length:297 start_codon:yes stop_codon:yes gene_type:complete
MSTPDKKVESLNLSMSTGAKVLIAVLPVAMAAAVALYRIDQAEVEITAVAMELEAEKENRDHAVQEIVSTNREVVETLTGIKINLAILCQTMDGARCQ